MSKRLRAIVLLAFLGPLHIAGIGRADHVADHLTGVLSELDAVSSAEMETQQRATAFFRIIEAAFDLEHMARASLISDMPPGANAVGDYLSAYRAHLVQGFLQKLRLHGPTVSTPTGIRAAPDGRRIFGFLSQAGGRSLRMGWVLCEDDLLRVCDVEAYGIRVSDFQARQFARSISVNGWDGFLADLRGGALVPPG